MLNVKSIKNDILSGVTVALALVPEAIAFSFVAGVNPVIGLYTAFMMGLITSIFGGRPGMISGATGAIAVVFADLVNLYGIEYLFGAVILMGIFQMLFGILRLGKFARIIPHPVMLGFVNGLAIVIFKAQLSQFKVLDNSGNFIWMKGKELYIMLALVLLTMLIINLLPKLTKAVPATLVAIIVVTLISIYLNSKGYNIKTVKDFAGGEIRAGFPEFHLPKIPISLKTLKIILPFSITAALVGLIESLLTLSLIDELTETRGKSNKECIGQGLANLINGFFGGMGGCAMIGQSMINVTSGGKGRLSGITAALSLIGFVVFGAKLIAIIPLAALVGVMFMVVIGTFEWESLKLGKKIPLFDLAIIIIVTIITVVHDLALAVVVGIILSALNFAWEKGKKIEIKVEYKENKKTYYIDGPLFFASSSNFKQKFSPKNDEYDNIIIDFKHSHVMDHSAIEAINFVVSKYREAGKKIYLRHLSQDCKKLLKNAEEIVEVNIMEDPIYYIADDMLD
ncbi:SulP family sulfate permease [Hypnocyclicus thermotrophus]|uniref:SulP family sulfate permease n=1 Tax=Hypnocyclicus thermotrophus TaxID=1627895 RepID=A0AA46E0A3_9FUSO|nr:SulP family inorganic anion transporter [Hypnocyclicus thermotrophus]TDT72351.1 SulP family sulfate permease [Hypnocyclicus thermotrophus]